MGKEIRCACCGHAIEESFPICSYCGFFHIVSLGSIPEDKKEYTIHRKTQIRRITEIGIRSYSYEWNAKEETYQLSESCFVKMADGIKCDGQIHWFPTEFGQSLQEDTPISIHIFYKVDGTQHGIRCALPHVNTEPFWKIGLEIDSTLNLVVYLGNSNTYSVSHPINILATSEHRVVPIPGSDSLYIGDYDGAARHGIGEILHSDGSSQMGVWINGVLDDKMTALLKDPHLPKDVDDMFWECFGDADLPTQEKMSYIKFLNDDVSVRVGRRIGQFLPPALLDEFDAIKDDSSAQEWLKSHFPQYREEVLTEIRLYIEELIRKGIAFQVQSE